jgi:hypothetical protein
MPTAEVVAAGTAIRRVPPSSTPAVERPLQHLLIRVSSGTDTAFDVLIAVRIGKLGGKKICEGRVEESVSWNLEKSRQAPDGLESRLSSAALDLGKSLRRKPVDEPRVPCRPQVVQAQEPPDIVC